MRLALHFIRANRCVTRATLILLLVASPAFSHAAETAAAAATGAASPTASSTTAAEPGALAEIIVTAEKRSENLEKVPLSIVALTSETLAETGAEDFSELAARIPSVVLNSAGPGRSSYSIRGIASVGGNAPTTGFYIDETPILPSGGDGANATIDPDLFDLARVEILRGPQGTLTVPARWAGRSG